MDEWLDVHGLQKQFTWVESESVQSSVPDEMHKAIDFFELFCDREVVECMVTETNRYAQQTLQSGSLKLQSRITKWSPTDPAEIKVFLGLLLWMGLVHCQILDKQFLV